MKILNSSGIKIIIWIVIFMGFMVGCFSKNETDRPTKIIEQNNQYEITPDGSGMLTPTFASESDNNIQEEPDKIWHHPDELKITYLKDGNIWLWTPETGKFQLTRDGNCYDIKISPDGQIVAYLKKVDSIHAELWAVNVDGNSDRRLISVGDLDTFVSDIRDPNAIAVLPNQFDWIPGTQTLAFNLQQIFQGPGVTYFDDLRLVDAVTFMMSTLLPSGSGGNFVYSPDGTKIVLSTPTDISLINSDGSNQQYVLSYDQVSTYSEYRYYAEPVWAQDSNSLRVAIPPSDPLAQSTQPTSLYFIPTDNSPSYQIGTVFSQPFFVSKVSYSPDFSHIIFLRDTGNASENLVELLIANPNGEGEWIYQSGVMIKFLGWNPNSINFVFSQGENQEVQMGSLDAASSPFINNPTGILKVSWINQDHFFFIRENIASFELVYANLDGSEVNIDSLTGAVPIYDFSFKNTSQ